MSNVLLIETVYADFSQGDIPGVLASFAPSLAWSEAEGNPYQPSGEAWVGPEAVLENLFKKLGSEWGAFTVHAGRYHDAGATVIVELPIDIGLQFGVVRFWSKVTHVTFRSIELSPSSNMSRSLRRARDSRDITVPTGMPAISAAS